METEIAFSVSSLSTSDSVLWGAGRQRYKNSPIGSLSFLLPFLVVPTTSCTLHLFFAAILTESASDGTIIAKVLFVTDVHGRSG